MGAPTVVVVAKTLLQPRSWPESVALRSVEAYSPSSLDVDILDGEVVIHQSRAIVHRFVPCPPSPFVEHYVMHRAHTLCPWVKNVVGLRALRIANEHPCSAPIVELADVAKLLAECEAAEDL
jgi:hypothetical protein